ncbi:MAG: hopanoid biosynthesis-associated protein HpnK [Candidatus Eremiobacteraeota bacterium]|nr:hopanoid biosynthesis-associated protein HpnK [Candidatus Eremiobacteraeota bacterium]
MKRLIVNADDFGAAPEINDAVERAHRNGILRSASLMVGASASQDAVERARRMPNLAVGLHVVLVHGRPVLPPQRVPNLVDGSGAFLTNLVRAGSRFFFRPGVRAQLAAEIRAQFERFAATGLTLDHANAQSHMHVHPTVFALLLEIGRDYGLRAVRIPREPLGGTRTIEPWLALMRSRAKRSGIVCNDYAFGVNEAGALTEERVLQILDVLPDGVTEIFFHPATARFRGADPGTEDFHWQEELAALTSRRVREAIERNGIESVTYGEVASRQATAARHPSTGSG